MRLSIVDLAQVPSDESPAQALANSIELAQTAERLGYSRYWVAEHHGIGSAIASSCPEVLIARIAAATSSIRVGSGSVLVNYTSPFKIAETFRVLHALYPERIDLGIGRASSTVALVDAAMRRGTPSASDCPQGESAQDPIARLQAWMEHEEQVSEIVAWLDDAFPEGHRYAPIKLLPGVAGGPEPWLLGASTSSAVLAGRLGLRYCYAAFINPREAPGAMRAYRAAFQPSPVPGAIDQPAAMLGIHLCCAETEAAANRLRASVELFYRTSPDSLGRPSALTDPGRAIRELGAWPSPTSVSTLPWSPHLSAGADTVAEMLHEMAALTGADEIIIQDLIFDHAERMRSYELIATACALTPINQEQPPVSDPALAAAPGSASR